MSFEWLNFFFSPISNGLIFVLLALGVFIAFRVLDIADLSLEGLFPFVTVLTCFLIRQGWHPLLAVLLCLLIGALTGVLNACLALYLKIPPLLSGIIMSTTEGMGMVGVIQRLVFHQFILLEIFEEILEYRFFIRYGKKIAYIGFLIVDDSTRRKGKSRRLV